MLDYKDFGLYMLAIVRIFLISILSIIICVFGIIYCLFTPFKPQHTLVFSRLFGCLAPIFGIQVEIRNLIGGKFPKNCIYISNHQNNYDMVTVSCVMQPNTITVGKKKLLWIPLFGQLYWLSGNIFIDRDRNVKHARHVLIKIIKAIKNCNISVWIFPEGTRNRGKGLLPFKRGAFYIALSAKVPIVPICVSNLSNNRIKLNRWSNGLVIIEIMPPIRVSQFNLHQIRRVTAYCHKIMQLKVESLDKEVAFKENGFI